MSYDISFKVKVEGIDRYVPVGDCDANITWNVRRLIEVTTGLPWLNEENNGLCKDVIPHIKKGLAELKKNPRKYKHYESPNGWGTVEGTINFFQEIIWAWERLCMWDEDLVDVATFWIE